MASVKSKVPKLRFKGFSGEWERDELSKVINLRNESGNKEDFDVDIELENLVIDKGIIIGDTSTRTQSNSIFKKNDILFGKLRPYLNKWWLADCDGIKSGEIWALYPKQGFSNLFIYGYIQTYQFLKAANLTSGTKMPRADWSILKEQSINFPLLEEQIQIGTFPQKFDRVIELQQNALTQTQNYKETMLQKMFPQKGEKVPRVRFKGFSGNWVKKKLEECFDERNERAESGELISVTINSGVVLASSLERRDTSSSDKSNYKMVCIGDIAYNSMRMWQGASGLSIYSGVLSPAYTVIIPKNNISGLFFSYQFKLPFMINMFRNNSQGLTSDTWNLKFPLLKEISVKIPSLKEQIQIGNFFQQLDKQIAEQQNKLTYYQTLKKAMLQRLFI